jgi:hypothetical protein
VTLLGCQLQRPSAGVWYVWPPQQRVVAQLGIARLCCATSGSLAIVLAVQLLYAGGVLTLRGDLAVQVSQIRAHTLVTPRNAGCRLPCMLRCCRSEGRTCIR